MTYKQYRKFNCYNSVSNRSVKKRIELSVLDFCELYNLHKDDVSEFKRESKTVKATIVQTEFDGYKYKAEIVCNLYNNNICELWEFQGSREYAHFAKAYKK